MAFDRPVVPARGLVHPAWLASLVVLVLNDHVLKGSGLLPAALTGKLSDVAGLVVAPLLLAWVLRVRTTRGWALAHVAVGLGFGAIQVWPAAAAFASSAMGAIGFPWVITPDLGDLATLPTLLLSFVGLRLALRQSAATHARHSAQWAAAGVGLWACAATSSPNESPEPEPFPVDEEPEEPSDDGTEPPQLSDLYADVFVHNGTDQDVVVRIRPLADEVDLDCETIAADPAGRLTPALFGLAESWTLPAGTNQPVLRGVDDGRACRAAWVELDAMPPRVLFWLAQDYLARSIPGAGDQGEDPSQLAVGSDPDGGRSWRPAEFAFEPSPRPAVCEPQRDGDRLAFAEPLPLGQWTLQTLELGGDGCFGLTLADQDGATTPWFLCVPAETMPLVQGDRLDIRPPVFEAATGAQGTWTGVSIETLEDQGVPPRRLVVTSGDGLPALPGLDLAIVPEFDCEAEVQPECGTVARPLHVSVAGSLGAASLRPGEAPTHFDDGTTALDLVLVHGTENFALAPSCALGPDALGPDLELVLAERPL